MKLKHTLPKISETDPFSTDKLDRKKHAETLTQFIKSIEEPLTLSIEAGWGHGKTTFLQMWTQYLKNEKFTCISFNAWEGDFSEDPLIPFVAELKKSITQIQSESGDTKAKFLALSEQLQKAGIRVAKRALPAAAKMLTAGLLDTDELIEEAAGNAFEKSIAEKFDAYEADKNNLDEFKKILSDLVSELKRQNKQLPLVFLIDELDRCRPTFALSLLERIKHIFNVDGIAFVIAIDREQLSESARTVYGLKTDATRYLRRFIDYAYTLPDPSPERYPQYLMEVLGCREYLANATGDGSASNNFLQSFIALSASFGLRLRDQEHAFSIMTVMRRTMHAHDYVDPYMLATLLVMKVANQDKYYQLIKNIFPLDSLYELLLQQPVGKKFMESNNGFIFEATMDVSVGIEDYISQKTARLSNAAKDQANHLAVKKWSVMKHVYTSGGNRTQFNNIVNSIEATKQFVN
ncbi:MAG: P-loop NTPase fold protein [Gallionella sp.]